jgi:hypothetical protein
MESVAKGCPQRVVLSLLLCSLVVNDLLSELNSDGHYMIYADDIAVQISGEIPSDSIRGLTGPSTPTRWQ